MKISTEIASAARIVGMEKAVALCGDAGFDAWDFSMFHLGYVDWKTGKRLEDGASPDEDYCLSVARRLKQIGEEHGMVCNQSHAPFPVHVPAVRRCLELAIACTAEAGGKICVIHPDNNKTAEENAVLYTELLPFAKSCGVKIATENMWNWDNEKNQSSFAACATGEDFKKHVDAVSDDHLVACLDLGHAEMRGSGDGAVNMIKTLGHRLQALHIHDNDLWHDSHQIPFSMSVDFLSIVRALKEIGYGGYFTLEADAYLSQHNEETVFEGLKRMRESARRLADMFEAL